MEREIRRAAKKRKREDDASAESFERPAKTSKLPPPDGLLSREQLLELTSTEFEEYAERLQRTRQLTATEERALKQQRRLIKNRESAQLSRKRKKNYIDELEQRLRGLEGENVTLKHELAELSVKNTELRGEVSFLNDMVEKSSLAGAFQELGVDIPPPHSEQSGTELEAAGSGCEPPADAIRALAETNT